MKKALITGITGQDGSYLTEFLIERGYEVHGIIRRGSTFNTDRIDHLYRDPHINNTRMFLHYGDLTDTGNLERIINHVKPEEVYHLGAQSHVRVSFDMPEYTFNVNASGTLRMLEAIKNSKLPIKFYNAASSEMFGSSPPPQHEETQFIPQSPYALSKVAAFNITNLYRDAHNIFACNGILFNHESPRRGQTFVTRKITLGLSKIELRREEKLYLGNLDAKRDWGFAEEYVKYMWSMLQEDKPDNYVIATGETHSVREFIEEACKSLCIDLKWEGLGVNEKGIDSKTNKTIIEIDPRYFRPSEVNVLQGNYQKAKDRLNFNPKIKFSKLVSLMVKSDYDSVKSNTLRY
ncbi:MAG: GDP-mannose 4,6-dehydratase [Nanoarchaeota archaeon]